MKCFYFQGPDRCDRCKNAKDGPFCVAECPMTKYQDENDVCQPCHENCDEGCTGPKNTVGPGGCNSCPLVIFHEDKHSITGCLRQDSECPEGFYKQMISSHSSYPLLAGKEVSLSFTSSGAVHVCINMRITYCAHRELIEEC